jgi:hypothetical protein
MQHLLLFLLKNIRKKMNGQYIRKVPDRIGGSDFRIWNYVVFFRRFVGSSKPAGIVFYPAVPVNVQCGCFC